MTTKEERVDIETIRQKLIEDLERAKLGYTADMSRGVAYIANYELSKMDMIDELIKNINKRFGKD